MTERVERAAVVGVAGLAGAGMGWWTTSTLTGATVGFVLAALIVITMEWQP